MFINRDEKGKYAKMKKKKKNITRNDEAVENETVSDFECGKKHFVSIKMKQNETIFFPFY